MTFDVRCCNVLPGCHAWYGCMSVCIDVDEATQQVVRDIIVVASCDERVGNSGPDPDGVQGVETPYFPMGVVQQFYIISLEKRKLVTDVDTI